MFIIFSFRNEGSSEKRKLGFTAKCKTKEKTFIQSTSTFCIPGMWCLATHYLSQGKIILIYTDLLDSQVLAMITIFSKLVRYGYHSLLYHQWHAFAIQTMTKYVTQVFSRIIYLGQTKLGRLYQSHQLINWMNLFRLRKRNMRESIRCYLHVSQELKKWL